MKPDDSPKLEPVMEGVFINDRPIVEFEWEPVTQVYRRRLVRKRTSIKRATATPVVEHAVPEGVKETAGWWIGASFVGMVVLVLFVVFSGYNTQQTSTSVKPVASQYTGQVVDYSQNTPITGATVTVQFGDKAQILSTNDHGQFFFEVVFDKAETNIGYVIVEADGYLSFNEYRTVQLAGPFDTIRLIHQD